MPSCAICKKPVTSGYVIEPECLNQLLAENARLKAERDALARYINFLDIDEAVCKLHPECNEFNHTNADCIACIINTLGRGLEGTQ